LKNITAEKKTALADEKRLLGNSLLVLLNKPARNYSSSECKGTWELAQRLIIWQSKGKQIPGKLGNLPTKPAKLLVKTEKPKQKRRQVMVTAVR